MIWSGILIYWANQAYIKIPADWAEKLNLDYRLAEGMGWHFLLVWFLLLNGLFYLLFLIFSGEWRELIPTKQTFKEAPRVVLHDLKILKEAPPVNGKFNAAQKLAYTAAVLMGIGSVVTGFAIWKPVQLGWLTSLLGGYEAARLEHFILMVGFIIFIIIHVLQVIRAGWNNFRAMIAGYEIEKD